MSNKAKYLSLFVMLTFTVGQVQYAYSSYFCTMTHKTYGPAMAAGSSGDGSCSPTACVTPAHGQQLVDASCMQLRLAEKKVVDSFASPDKAPSHIVAIVAILPGRLFSVEPATFITVAIQPCVFPPPDIPTLNSNLRI
jgi:hypothetical protein